MSSSGFQVLADGLGFPEAPIALPNGCVMFAELARSCVSVLRPDGSVTRYVTTGSPNGLAVGPDGAVYIANNGGADYRPGHFLPVGIGANYAGGSIQRLDPTTGEFTTIYTHCGEHRLSAPNDLVFDRHGGFYFTDTGKRYARTRDHGGVYYAAVDGSFIREIAFPVLTPNGIGLSPDERTLYVADMEPARLWAFDLDARGVVRKAPFPSPHGGRLVAGLPGFQRFDSLKVCASGRICVATLVTGGIHVFNPDGSLHERIPTPDHFPTNLCFGGDGHSTAWLTFAQSGQLAMCDWAEPGLKLHFEDRIDQRAFLNG